MQNDIQTEEAKSLCNAATLAIETELRRQSSTITGNRAAEVLAKIAVATLFRVKDQCPVTKSLYFDTLQTLQQSLRKKGALTQGEKQTLLELFDKSGELEFKKDVQGRVFEKLPEEVQKPLAIAADKVFEIYKRQKEYENFTGRTHLASDLHDKRQKASHITLNKAGKQLRDQLATAIEFTHRTATVNRIGPQNSKYLAELGVTALVGMLKKPGREISYITEEELEARMDDLAKRIHKLIKRSPDKVHGEYLEAFGEIGEVKIDRSNKGSFEKLNPKFQRTLQRLARATIMKAIEGFGVCFSEDLSKIANIPEIKGADAPEGVVSRREQKQPIKKD